MNNLQGRFTDEQRDKLEKISKQAKVPIAAVLRWAVEAYNPPIFLSTCPINSQNDNEKYNQPEQNQAA